MIVKRVTSSSSFSANDKQKNLEYNYDTLIDNNIFNRTRIGIDKLSNALTVYPAKGLKGSKNANFYEFLTMGTVPYLVGSGMLIAVFNTANKYFSHFAKSKAAVVGQKMALGVVLYGVAKNISKTFISAPVKAITGVDIEQPYAKVIYELPDDINDTDITSIEHHKVFESVDFPRWDQLYGDEKKGQKRNYKYDNIAKRLGYKGELRDSDQEVKPRIKEIVVKSKLAQNISSYLWAATAVGLAFQKPWENYFKVMTFKFWKGKEFLNSVKSFGRNLAKSAKEFYNGEGKGVQKYAGKVLLGLAAASSILGVVNAVISSNTPSKAKVINKEERYVKA